jgi:diguanylate cyclase (GGDEF)-like protein
LSEAKQTAAHIEELDRRSALDGLTQTANRSFLEQLLSRKLEFLRNLEESFGILFLDIDDFKRLNDTYSHNDGDQALKVCAQTLLRNTRKGDTVGRWGGEEFVVVLSGVQPSSLHHTAEKLRAQIASAFFFASDGRKVTFSVSIGGTIAERQDSVETMIYRADKLMYKSKTAGKNCVSIEI